MVVFGFVQPWIAAVARGRSSGHCSEAWKTCFVMPLERAVLENGTALAVTLVVVRRQRAEVYEICAWRTLEAIRRGVLVRVGSGAAHFARGMSCLACICRIAPRTTRGTLG